MGIAIERLVIAHAMREIPDIIFGCGLDIFAGPGGLVESDQFALTLDILVRYLIGYGFLPFITLFYVGFCVCHVISPLSPVV